MTSPVITVSPNDTLAHVRNLMIRHSIGRVVVVENERPVGIVTRTDIVRLFIYSKKKAVRLLDDILVSEVMTAKPYTIRFTRSIKAAAHAMLRYRISGLPVVDEEDRLVGIITKTDIARAYAERYHGKALVKDYMRTRVTVVKPNHTVYYVVEALSNDEDSKVLVVDNGKLLGIIAASDLAYLSPTFTGARESFRRRIAVLPKGRLGALREYFIPLAVDIMTPDPITVEENEDLAAAADAMLKHGISSLPVVDGEGTLKGLVSKNSVLKAVDKE